MKPTAKKLLLLLALSLAIGSTALPKNRLPAESQFQRKVLSDQNNGPFFWLGTTQWELFHGYTLEDAKTIIERSKKDGFTVIQVKLFGSGDCTKPDVYGQKAMIDDDPGKPNEAYFRKRGRRSSNGRRQRPDHPAGHLPSAISQITSRWRRPEPWAKWLAEHPRRTLPT